MIMFMKDDVIVSLSNTIALSNLPGSISLTVADDDNMLRNIVAVGDIEISSDGVDWSEMTLAVDFTSESMREIFVRPSTGLESGSGKITVEEIGA